MRPRRMRTSRQPFGPRHARHPVSSYSGAIRLRNQMVAEQIDFRQIVPRHNGDIYMGRLPPGTLVRQETSTHLKCTKQEHLKSVKMLAVTKYAPRKKKPPTAHANSLLSTEATLLQPMPITGTPTSLAPYRSSRWGRGHGTFKEDNSEVKCITYGVCATARWTLLWRRCRRRRNGCQRRRARSFGVRDGVLQACAAGCTGHVV